MRLGDEQKLDVTYGLLGLDVLLVAFLGVLVLLRKRLLALLMALELLICNLHPSLKILSVQQSAQHKEIQ